MPAGDDLLGRKTGGQQFLAREPRAEKGIRRDGCRGGGGGAPPLATGQRQALKNLDGETLPFRPCAAQDLGCRDRGGVVRRIARNLLRPDDLDSDRVPLPSRNANLVPDAVQRETEHIDARTQVGNGSRSKRADELHAPASSAMSLNRPAAVTASPAPGPWMTRGFVR